MLQVLPSITRSSLWIDEMLRMKRIKRAGAFGSPRPACGERGQGVRGAVG
jgi:hypothetical protein